MGRGPWLVLVLLLAVFAASVTCVNPAVKARLEREATRELQGNANAQAKAGVGESALGQLIEAKRTGKRHVMFAALDYESDLLPLIAVAQGLSRNFGQDLIVSLAMGKEGMSRLEKSSLDERIVLLPGGLDTLQSLPFLSDEERGLLGMGQASDLGLSLPLSHSGRVMYETFSQLNDSSVLPDLMVIDQWCWSAMEVGHLFSVEYFVHIPQILSAADSPFADELLPYSTPLLGTTLWWQPWVRWARAVGTRVTAMANRGNSLPVRKLMHQRGEDPYLWETVTYVFDERMADKVTLVDSTYGLDLFPSDSALNPRLQIVGDLISSYDALPLEEVLSRPSIGNGQGETLAERRETAIARVSELTGRNSDCLLVSLDNRLLGREFVASALPAIIRQLERSCVIVSLFVPGQEQSISDALKDIAGVVVVLQEEIAFVALQRMPEVTTVLSTCSHAEITSALASRVSIVCAPFTGAQEVAAKKAVESGVAAMLEPATVRRLLGKRKESERDNSLSLFMEGSGGSSAATLLIHSCVTAPDSCQEALTSRNEAVLAAVVEAGYDRGLPTFWQLQPVLGVLLPVAVVVLIYACYIEPLLRHLFAAHGRNLIDKKKRK
mmetsp:Transcript_11067/g.45144  ORF Transcript_11067/g.45144 Transcript_11067/m.45144 type:complete len:609 (+) Transcript_11067:2-1828(+)